MIKKIIVIDNDRYLYENERNVLLKMLNNGLTVLHLKNKRFNITKNGSNTAIIKIYKITDKFFFLKDYILLTTLNIKYN